MSCSADGPGGDVKLDVVVIAVEVKTVVTYDIAKGEHVQDEVPWGTPCVRGAVEEGQLLILMNCCLSERYDLSQVSAVPVMLREDSRRERRMEWLMVSKAAVRSRRMRIVRCPESEERRSLVILRRAVYVLCCERNPDFSGSNRSLEMRWVLS